MERFISFWETERPWGFLPLIVFILLKVLFTCYLSHGWPAARKHVLDDTWRHVIVVSADGPLGN